jgi:hypothetical protein
MKVLTFFSSCFQSISNYYQNNVGKKYRNPSFINNENENDNDNNFDDFNSNNNEKNNTDNNKLKEFNKDKSNDNNDVDIIKMIRYKKYELKEDKNNNNSTKDFYDIDINNNNSINNNNINNNNINKFVDDNLTIENQLRINNSIGNIKTNKIDVLIASNGCGCGKNNCKCGKNCNCGK